jgi:hypothetical protein
LNFDSAASATSKMGVPNVVFVATIVLQLFAGMAIALGIFTRLGAIALAIFCFLTAFMFHTHFGVRDELLHFEKDLAIAGGLLVLRSTASATGRLKRHCRVLWEGDCAFRSARALVSKHDGTLRALRWLVLTAMERTLNRESLIELRQGASILARVVRRESLGARNMPSRGESKSSMRKMAEATQIAGRAAVSNWFKRSSETA